MSRWITSRRLFVLLVAVIVVIAAAGVTARARGARTAWPLRVVMDVQNTVSGWLYRPAAWLSGVMSGLHDLRTLYQENAALKKQLLSYSALQAQLQLAQEENVQLSKMVGFKTSNANHWTLAPAHVVGRDPSSWRATLTIDAGTAVGVQVNMPVISPEGALVGKVIAAGRLSSTVSLITDAQSGDGVSALVLADNNSPVFGIVTGSEGGPTPLSMQFLSAVANVKVGQSVVTSGYSDIFPKGILIGTVKQVGQGMPGLTRDAAVQPAADLDNLQDVFVILRGQGS
ncbi:MAG: rod shape-determining protein MreC [Thermoflavifilum sp.]|nr:rod shape-determining protein MreC [Thermoflavifilum sp.]MCL6513971.1 rod shape-determining protein MreC [Alicyclobacillus sp.]